MANALEILADWAASCSNIHSDLAYQRARTAVLDTVACMLAGVQDEATKCVRQSIESWGSGQATIIGGGCIAAPWAAMVNGTAAHALDYDDYDLPSVSHPSAVLVPALLALAEENTAGGKQVLDAYIVGLEVMARIGMAVNMSHYETGWHATATIGALGTAAACARLMQLDASGIANAISLATSMASGYKSQFGTMAKPLHAGVAAQSGIIAASMSRAGVNASLDTLDGRWSFLTLHGGSNTHGFDQVFDTLGRQLSIDTNGLVIKPYPCCGYPQRSISGILQLREQHRFGADEIDSIIVKMAERNAQILTYPEPLNAAEARFSLHYCVAVAALTGDVTLADFAADNIQRTEVRAILPKVLLQPYHADPNGSDCSPDDPDEVIVHLKGRDGPLIANVAWSPGSPQNPLSDAQLNSKFRQCAEAGRSTIDSEKVLRLIQNFEMLDDVRTLMSALSAA